MVLPSHTQSQIASDLYLRTMKNKAQLLLIICSFIFVAGFSQNRSINFIEKGWSEIISMAKAQNKMIFLDGYASWCGPCKWMAANMFTRDTIADFYNNNFICVHFDMEKGEGVQLAQTYQVRAYPTLLFLSPAGEMVHKRVGAPQKVQDYLDMGKTSMTPGEGFNDYVKKFQDGNRDPKFIIKLLTKLEEAYMPINEPLGIYFESQKESALISRDNWTITYLFVKDMNSKEFNYLVTHRNEFSKLYTKDSVDTKISGVFIQAMTGLIRSRNFSDSTYNLLKNRIKETGFEQAGMIIFTGDLTLYQMKSDIQKFTELAYSGTDKYYGTDFMMLNRMAGNFLQITAEPKYLERAAEWAKKSIDLKSTAENNDTYASILFKLGRKTEAIQYEKAALAIAQREKLNTQTYLENLNRFLKE